MEYRVSVKEVRDLVSAQFPMAVGEVVELLNEGWDNIVFRIGSSWVGRFPKYATTAELLSNEIRWVSTILEGIESPLRTSQPVFAGVPGASYPYCWSIAAFIEGAAAQGQQFSELTPAAAFRAATHLGEFLAAIHRPQAAPADAPRNPYRGTPLSERVPLLTEHLARYQRNSGGGGVINLEAIRQGFEQAVSASPWVGPPLWCHGDIHPGNLILDRGELVGVIDFGDCCAGDPASDLAVCWWWFPAAEREAFQRSYDQALRRQQGEAAVEDADRWLRARGWAYALCLAVASNDKSSTAMRHSAEHALVEHLGCG